MKTDKAKKQKRISSMRISEETDRQLKYLAELWGENNGEVLARCIARYYEYEIKSYTKAGT